MKKQLIILALFAVSLISYGQTLTPIANKKGLMGYQNEEGTIVIKQAYDYAEPFNENGLAKVGKGDSYGLIRKDGTFALPLKYSNIDQLEETHAVRIQDGKKYGLIDGKTGSIIIKPTYTYISKYNCYGLAWFASGGKVASYNGKTSVQNGKIGIIDASGSILLTPQYKGVYEFSNKTDEGSQAVYGESRLLEAMTYNLSDTLKTDCTYLGIAKIVGYTSGSGLIDKRGNVLLKTGKHDVIAYPRNNIIRYWDTSKKSVTFGYYDLSSGKDFASTTINSALSNIKYTTHIDFIDQIALRRDNENNSSIINRSGSTIVNGLTQTHYCHIEENTGYICGVNQNNKVVIYDGKGNKALGNLDITAISLPIPDKSDEITFCVKIDGKYGLADKDGNLLIQPQYDYIEPGRYGLYATKNNDKWGYVNIHNQVKVPIEYIGEILPVETSTKSVWVQQSDSLYYCYNINKKTLYKDGYAEVSSFKDGWAWARTTAASEKNKKGILYGEDGQIYVNFPFTYNILSDVKSELKKSNKILTESQSKSLVLKLNQSNLHHKMAEVISEDEWDY
jgi:hypothetical protein